MRDINEKMAQVTEGLVLAELAMVKAPYILIGPFYALLVLTVLWVYFDRTAIVGIIILIVVLIPLLGKCSLHSVEIQLITYKPINTYRRNEGRRD